MSHPITRAVEAESPVDGCQHCGLPKRLPNGYPHAQRWTEAAGWHGWTAPTQEQIKARMIARRAAQTEATMQRVLALADRWDEGVANLYAAAEEEQVPEARDRLHIHASALEQSVRELRAVVRRPGPGGEGR